MTLTQNLALYASTVAKIHPGDIIACAGVRPISKIIDLFTRSHITHVMQVRQPVVKSADVVVTQSTLGGGELNGAQSDSLQQVLISQYPNGRAWLLTLAEPIRSKIDWFKFYQAIGEAEDRVKYDWWGLVLFAIGQRAKPNPKAMFCDAYVIWILQQCGALPPGAVGVDPRETDPQEFVSMPLFSGCTQIWGEPGTIQFSKV
jgi:hypothetical protein